MAKGTGLFKTVQGKKVEKTQAEVEEEQRGGQEFIRQREGMALELQKQGQGSVAASRNAALNISQNQTIADIQAEANTPEAIARKQLEQQAAKANLEQALLQQELARVNAEEKTKQETSFNAASPTAQGQPLIEEKRNPLVQNKFAGRNVNLPQPIEDVQQKVAEIKVSTLQSAAKIYLDIKNSLQGRESVDIEIAKSNFEKGRAFTQDDIRRVRENPDYYESAYKNLLFAEDAIQELENTSKLTGSLKLRYWLTGGKDLETDIRLEKEIYQKLRQDLEDAKTEGNIKRAKLNIGLQ